MAQLVETASGSAWVVNDETGPLSEEESLLRLTHSYYCDLVSYYFDDCRADNITPTAVGLVKYLTEQYEAVVNDDRGLNCEPEYYI